MARTNVRVSAIILDKDKILLMHRKKNGEEYWVFPGGGMEDTETQMEGIIREVKEETNLDVVNCTLDFMAFNEASNKEEPFFRCEVKEGGKLEIKGEEKDKHSEENWYHLEWVKINDINKIWLVPELAAKEVVKRYSSIK